MSTWYLRNSWVTHHFFVLFFQPTRSSQTSPNLMSQVISEQAALAEKLTDWGSLLLYLYLFLFTLWSKIKTISQKNLALCQSYVVKKTFTPWIKHNPFQIPSLLLYLNLSLSYSWSFPVPSLSAPCLFFNPTYLYPLPFFSLFFSFLLSKTHNSLSCRMLFLANLIPFRFHTYTDSPTSSLTSNIVSFLHFPLVFLIFSPSPSH